MKKNAYLAPSADFVRLTTDKDILAGSYNNPDDDYQENYGSSIVI